MEPFGVVMGGKVVEKITERLLDQTGTQYDYLFSFTTILNNFRKATKRLELAQKRRQNDVDTARGNDEQIEEDVQKWLDDVENILKEIQILEQKVEENKHRTFKYKLSKKLSKMTTQVIDLLNTYPSEQVGRRIDPQPVEFSQGHEFNFTHSSKLAFGDIMDSLKKDDVNMIGVYGMGGIGKTILVQQIGQVAIKNNLFDKVLMIRISSEADFYKIQEKIAFGLKLNIDAEKDEASRASRLLSRLKQERKTLIILDDVWKPMELRQIGIEFDKSQIGCKYIMTTSDLYLCRRMGCQKIVYLDIMTELEALTLFKQNAGLDNDVPAMADMASQFAKTCGGLPIAIVSLACALKDKSESQWKDSLRRLNSSKLLEIDGIDGNKNAYKSFRLTYNRLNNKDLKLCFLLCSLYPEDYEISTEDLTRLVATELDGVGSIEDKRSSVEASIETLIAKCLLLEGGRDGGRKVKMHYMVRHFALWILSDPENFFTGTYIGESNGFPTHDVFSACMAVSIMEKQNKELSSGLIYEKLRVLLVRAQNWKSISNDVFKVLTNLRALHLEDCELLKDVSLLRYLKNIETLSFRGSSITQVPDGISEMLDLKLLDVSNCRNLFKIPRGMLEKLSNLEELYTHGTGDNLWGAEIGKAHLSELKALTRLNIFSLKVRREQLVEGFILSKFESDETTKSIMILFNWSRGDSSSDILRIENADSTWMNALGKWELTSLPDIRCVLEGPTPIVPFANLVDISIDFCNKLTFVFSQSLARSIRHLQKLSISNCYDLEHVMMEDEGDVTSSDHNQTPCFANLERIDIEGCDKLKYIMSIATARRLEKLKHISVPYNVKLKQIFGPDSEEEERIPQQIVLPLLTELGCSEPGQINGISCPSLQKLKVGRCYERDLNRLANGKQLESIDIIFSADTWYSVLALLVKQPLSTLKDIDLTWISGLELMFDLEGAGNEEPLSLVSIQTLELLSVYDLTDIWSGSIYTPNLTQLKITDCDSLRNICSPTLARNLPLLKVLFIGNCDKLEAIIGEEDNHGEPDHPSTAYFHNLEEIGIWACDSLSYIFSPTLARNLLLLNHLKIEGCSKLKAIIDEDSDGESDHPNPAYFPNLTQLEIRSCRSLRNIFSPTLARNLPLLKQLEIEICDQLEAIVGKDKHGESDHPSPTYFHNLTHLNVTYCRSLRFIFSPKAKSLPLLKVLALYHCSQLLAIIGGGLDHPNPTFFPNLTQIAIGNCDKMTYIFPLSVALGGLPKLSILWVKGNFNLYAVFKGMKGVGDTEILILPLLAVLILDHLPKLESFSPIGYHFIFPYLKDIRLTAGNSVVTSFTLDFDGSVHAETKDDSVMMGPGFKAEKKEDLPRYVVEGSSSSFAPHQTQRNSRLP